MIIRPAREADVDALARVAVAAYRAGFAEFLEPETLARCDAAFFAARFAQAWPRMTLAEEGGAVVAFALITDRHLDMLFVDPARIGRGIGARLLAALDVASLECFAANLKARRFYERAGWTLESAYAREYMGRARDFVCYRAPLTASA